MLLYKTGCFYTISPLIFPNSSHSKVFYQSVGKICSHLGFSVFIDLSPHHNLTVGLFSKQSTLAIALLCGTLRKTIFATAHYLRHNSWGGGKANTKHMGLRRRNSLGSTGEARMALSASGIHAA